MIAIKGMGMPSCCYSCRLARFAENPHCVVLLKGIDLAKFERPKWCPLIEVKDNETN